ncbi:SDR family NAD(P)-dependent oxidoreductase [Chryseobacterium arthrosphaerae]|uniref:SDR family NAD(P)-dependent oxidoreductase n=1 Tax=Chryseobacterium arthrosphaerae TaxID=651561 RepID=UPI00241EBB12|nr:SDR family NAD(P)-dependent oxidoreductase [Chryseobacterium arthrosphaerae]
MDPYPFSNEEWETCLKVLEALQENPLHNPDNQRFKTLISSIRKKAQKNIRKNPEKYRETLEGHSKNQDLDILKKSVIVSKALENETLYTHVEEQNQTFSWLKKPQLCYCCHQPYHEVHFFYHKLCPPCADENYKNRNLHHDFTGQTVIITGGRVKIGYAAALKFLRSGATVIVTSRFPALAFEQFQKEEDYRIWKDQLFLYGLDLRSIKSIHEFSEYCYRNFGSIEILINNAAQTIKYSSEYYQPLVSKEKFLLSHSPQNLIDNKTPVNKEEIEFLNLSHPYSPEMPVNRFGQPKDSRDKNSWNSLMDEIGTEELLEVNLINHISPYLLISALKPLMKKSTVKNRHIINVTSTEGQFSYKSKNEFHPHTNMTKAALNMLTKTSAPDFIKDNIFMNAVDVGWISTGAIESKREKLFEKTRIPPLDSVDGALRIFHPIVQINTGNHHLYGKLLKNYKETEW